MCASRERLLVLPTGGSILKTGNQLKHFGHIGYVGVNSTVMLSYLTNFIQNSYQYL
jgi:hypothetical protein